MNENVELWPSLVVERLSKFVVQKNGGLQWKWLAKFEFQTTNESLECKALTNYEPKQLYGILMTGVLVDFSKVSWKDVWKYEADKKN